MMRRISRCALVACLAVLLGGDALAQSTGQASPGAAVPKPAVPAAQDAPANAKAGGEPPKHTAKIAGNFGQWALICEDDKDPKQQNCSLVQALVERSSQKLAFRVSLGYGPQGNLVLRIDGPTGVALQKGLEFSPDDVKIYRLPFQTCVPRGCSAVLVVADDLKQDLQKSAKGTITVYALNGRAVRALAELQGFADGLVALDKRRAKP